MIAFDQESVKVPTLRDLLLHLVSSVQNGKLIRIGILTAELDRRLIMTEDRCPEAGQLDFYYDLRPRTNDRLHREPEPNRPHPGRDRRGPAHAIDPDHEGVRQGGAELPKGEGATGPDHGNVSSPPVGDGSGASGTPQHDHQNAQGRANPVAKVFVVMLKERPIDGWSRSGPEHTSVLGHYLSRASADLKVQKVLTDQNRMYCAIGKPWVEEHQVET